jgi:lipopolysaccharide transport system ATP-binding protein
LRERIHSGTTVVFVSHGDAQIRQVCNRALWIEHGRSVMLGEVDDVLKAYHADPHAQGLAAAAAAG